MVGLGGLEPPASPLSGVRSNQLSYRPGEWPGGQPMKLAFRKLDEIRTGVQPAVRTVIRSSCYANSAISQKNRAGHGLGAKDKPFV